MIGNCCLDTSDFGTCYTGCPKNLTPPCCFAKMSITTGTFTAKFYTHTHTHTHIYIQHGYTYWPYLLFNFKVYRVWGTEPNSTDTL